MRIRILFYGVAFNSTRMLIGAISTLYILSKGLSLADIGLMKAFQAIIILFLDVPLAYIADRYSRKLSILSSVAFGSLWLILMGVGETRVVLYAAEAANAISIALISGAFMAYLIDQTTKDSSDPIEIKNVIAQFNKYQFLGMAIFAFIGSAFISVESQTIWIISATISFVLLIAGMLVLPADIDHSRKNDSKKSLSNDIEIVKTLYKEKKQLLPIALSFITVSFFYQILIQYWQPMSFSNIEDKPSQGIIFGILFSLTLLIQSLVSHISEKIKDIDNLVSISNILNILAIALFSVAQYTQLPLIPVAIILMFAGNRLTTISFHSVFHSIIPSDLRTTFDSAVSSLLRLILIAILPLLAFSIDYFGWWALVGVLIVSSALLPIIKSVYSAKKCPAKF